jgi:hypothetical protein
MGEPDAVLPPPQLHLTLELTPELHRVGMGGDEAPDGAAIPPLVHRLQDAAGELLATLGIPGEVQVELLAWPDPPERDHRFLQIRVAGVPCPFPEELVPRVHSLVTHVVPGTVPGPTGVREWLTRVLAGEGEGEGEGGAEELREPGLAFLIHLVVEALRRQPALLVGPAQAEAYRASLQAALLRGGGPSPTLPEWRVLQSLLRRVVAQGVSVAPLGQVAELVAAGVEAGTPGDDLAEELIAELRPDQVQILLPTAYLREITLEEEVGAGGEEERAFSLLREGMAYETGLAFPRFRFVPTESLPDGTFAFRVNHLSSLPRVGLREGERLVNGPPETGGVGREVLNPANLNPCTLLSAEAAGTARPAGGAVWGPLGFLVLCFSAELRERSGAFVDSVAVEEALNSLATVFPAPVEAVRRRYPLPLVTRVLRRLADGRVSLRNLRRILEAMLDFDHVVVDAANLIVFDPRLPTANPPTEEWLRDPAHIAAFVRTDLKRAISHQHTRGQASLIVFLLEPEAERVLAEGGASMAWEERFRQAVRDEVRRFPPSTQLSALLTTVEASGPLREMMATEFPRLPVLAYQELAPELNIHPIARITMEGE